jgi:outer membrane protein TolC
VNTRRAIPGAVLLLAALAAACSVPRVCREAEATRVRSTMQERTDALGLGPDRVLTLAECEEIAIRNNLEYRIRLMETKLADEDVREAMTGLLPRAAAELTKTQRSNEATLQGTSGNIAPFEDQNLERFHAGALIPVWDFGATQYAWEIAKDQRDQKRLATSRARQTLIRDVRVAYARLAGAIEENDLVVAQVAAAKEELRVAESLEREGLAARSDTSFVGAALARAELELAVATRNLTIARAALSQTLSVPTWTDYRIETSPQALPSAPASKEAVVALELIALRCRPELFSQDLERHVAAAQVRSQFAEFFPKIGGTVDFEWSSNSILVNPSFWKGGLIVAHSLLDRGATIIRYRKAQGQERVEEERALLVGMGVLYEVDFRILELVRALDGIVAAERLVAAQATLLESVRTRYREGFESGANLSRALADWHTARRALNVGRTQSFAAWFELLAAMGVERLAPEAESRSEPLPAAETRTQENP